jgi:hypothetical protein
VFFKNELGLIECTLLLCHNKWGGLVVKKFISILGVQKLIPTNDMGCGQRWNVDQIFTTYLANIG